MGWIRVPLKNLQCSLAWASTPSVPCTTSPPSGLSASAEHGTSQEAHPPRYQALSSLAWSRASAKVFNREECSYGFLRTDARGGWALGPHSYSRKQQLRQPGRVSLQLPAFGCYLTVSFPTYL